MTPKKKFMIFVTLILVVLGVWGFYEKLRNQRFQNAVLAAAKQSIQQNIVMTVGQRLTAHRHLQEMVVQAILDSCEVEVQGRMPLSENKELISYQMKVLSKEASQELIKITLASLEKKKVLNAKEIQEVIKKQIDSKYPKQVIVNRMSLQNDGGHWHKIEQP